MIMIIQILKLIGTSTNVLVHDFLSPKFLVKQCFFANCLLPVACCSILLRKVWNRSNFSANNSQHFFCSVIAKRSATMLDLFAQLFQHCWGHARSLRMDYKDLWVVFFPRCTAGPNIVGSCCIRLHTTANTHATTPNIVGVVASVSTQPNMHQPASKLSSSTSKRSKPLGQRSSEPPHSFLCRLLSSALWLLIPHIGSLLAGFVCTCCLPRKCH